VDCVGTDETLALAAGAIAPGGHVSVLGRAARSRCASEASRSRPR
jgi:threonine dehydrogenase-like Zn-dependent dehydrogenase